MNAADMRSRLLELLTTHDGTGQVNSWFLESHGGLDSVLGKVSAALDAESQRSDDTELCDDLKLRLHAALDASWEPQAKTLAVFWDAQQTDMEPFTLALPVSIADRISQYRLPDVRPLIPLLGPQHNATILAYSNFKLQVYTVSLGQVRPLVSAMAPHLTSKSPPPSLSAREADRDNAKRLVNVCTTLINSQHKPLVLAAQHHDLESLRRWLPRSIAWDLETEITLPQGLTEPDLTAFIQQQNQLQRDIVANSLAQRLVESRHAGGAAAAGGIATLRAIQQQVADRLLITHSAIDEPVGHCKECAANPAMISPMGACTGCGQLISDDYQHALEACWMAFEQRVPVTPVASDQLQFLGGVGCLLRGQEAVAIRPVAAPVEHHRLDLVA